MTVGIFQEKEVDVSELLRSLASSARPRFADEKGTLPTSEKFLICEARCFDAVAFCGELVPCGCYCAFGL